MIHMGAVSETLYQLFQILNQNAMLHCNYAVL